MRTLTPISIKVKDYIIKNSDNEKVLRVTVAANLNFNCYLENILKKAVKKVHVLARITPYMSIPKRKLLMNSFFTSQFNYCPLTWMSHSRTRQIVCMKGASLYTLTRHDLLKNC